MEATLTSRAQDNLKVCIIGAGAGGICAAIKLKTELNHDNFVVFESRSGFGGTWLANTYPGCACDIPSHLYSYSFAPKPDWTTVYSTQEELLEYFTSLALKHGLATHTKFNTKVEAVTWLEDSQQWRVSYADTVDGKFSNELFNVVITATGILRAPHIPEAFHAFKGPKCHSAEWDDSIELSGKTVAVVGSGSSAIQILPSIADQVGQLMTFQRNPGWLVPRSAREFPPILAWILQTIPLTLWILRLCLYCFFEVMYNAALVGKWNIIRRVAQWISESHMKSQVKDDKLRKQLTPTYPIGFRRVMVSSEYFPIFNKGHVSLITQPITRVTSDSLITADGKEYKPDVLILATGFKAQDFFYSMKIYGVENEDILATWKDKGPSTYLGIVANALPNFFMVHGPNTGLAHNSEIFMFECQVGWIMNVMKEFKKRTAEGTSVRSLRVQKRCEKEFMKEILETSERTCWGAKAGISSWYTDQQGNVVTLYPQSCTSYYRHCRQLNFDKFLFT